MPVEERRDGGKRRICLMGAARALLPEGAAPEKEELGISKDPEAMELLALLVLGREFLPPGGVKEDDKADGEVRRDWLAATLYPALFAGDNGKRKAREGVRYRLDKLHPRPGKTPAGNRRPPPLPIRVHLGERERATARVTWKGVCVDVLALREAARQIHSADKQQEIIALGDRPLLEGMAYPWLQGADFQKVGAELDAYFLTALARRADSQIVQMESANAAGRLAESDACRSRALPLLDKAAERLRGYGERLYRPECAALLPFQSQFSELRRRAAYPLPDTGEADKAADAVPPPAHNLPSPVTSFVGRTQEQAEIKQGLEAGRMVTLTGMGGCGKTRLAVQAAWELLGGRESVRLVELAALTAPDQAPQAVATALGVAEQKGLTLTDALTAFLQDRRTLLLLDNCEHLLGSEDQRTDSFTDFVAALLQSCPFLSILATSREPLNIAGEQLCRVPPLPFPASDFLPVDAADPVAALLGYDAARLFIDRALKFRRFTPGPENVASVAAICAALDGIPLALELAAARIKALPLERIAEMLSDRFGLLTSGRRESPSRHKTLRAVIDWSYDLLNAPEQALLCRLSVFAGGWSLDEAEAVGASKDLPREDVLNLLESLVDKSLVIADLTASPGRYRMLETVRQYAQDLLREGGEWEETRRKHRDYFLSLAEEAALQLRGPDQKKWRDRLETEHNNFRAALAWRSDETALRLACALSRFWWLRGYLEEGRKWLEQDIHSSINVSEEVRAGALIGAGRLAHVQGRFQEAKQNFGESLAFYVRLGDRRGSAEAIHNLGDVASHLGEYEEAGRCYKTSLMQFRELDDQVGAADALAGLGMLEQNQGEYSSAEERHRESLALRQEGKDPQGIADSLMFLSDIARRRGALAEARSLLEESLSLHLSLDSKHRTGSCLTNLGRIVFAQGNAVEARKLLHQSLELSRAMGRKWDSAQALVYLATVAYDRSDYAEAESLHRQSLALFEQMGAELAVAVVSANLGSVVGVLGRHSEAEQLFSQSLRKFRELQDRESIAATLEVYAILVADIGQSERAVKLWGASEELSALIGFRRPADEDARYNQAVQGVQEAMGAEAFKAALAEGRAMTWEQAVAFALGEDTP